MLAVHTKFRVYHQRPRLIAATAQPPLHGVHQGDILSHGGFAVELRGPDAEAFLDRMVANRLPQKAGRLALSHFLNAKGTIESETSITKLDDNHYFLVFAGFFELRVRDWLQQHKRSDENVDIDVVSEQYGVLSINGPASRQVLAALTDCDLGNDAFPWLSAQSITLAGVTVRAIRVSYVGELGWELYAPMADLERIYNAVWAAGEAHGIANFGSFALNAMRMEKAYKGAGEFTTEVTLPEAGAMRFCKTDKGDFVGREATEASLAAPLPWVCVHLQIDTPGVDCTGSETVFHQGERSGQITTAGYGHRVEKSLAFAYVKPEHAAPGTALEVLLLDGKASATVLADALYDPQNALPRSAQ